VALPHPSTPAPAVHDRRRHGVYLTPPEVVDAVLGLALPQLPPGPVTVVDPACGDGAFLEAAAAALPAARLLGLELSAPLAQAARARVPRARVLVGDALRGGWEALEGSLTQGAFELWLGNPPYNGTSPLLGDPVAYASLRARIGLDPELPRGTSLRDDYAFFLLLAAERLRRRRGVLAWVTSATLLDAFLYASLRRRLLDTLALEDVVDLGGGLFPGTRVRTCITVWRSAGPRRRARFRSRLPGEAFRLGPVEPLAPEGPECRLRPTPPLALALDAAWRGRGEPLDLLVPVHCTGLKTRFDELLVDDDAEVLLARVGAFLRTRPGRLGRFAAAQGLDPGLVPKLEALRRSPRLSRTAERSLIRPFFRYAGAGHRGAIPESSRAFCYLDRRLIPRGDHRLVGRFDPHACRKKLVFNLRELPLSAALLDQAGCIPAHRHTRFAPLAVPERVWALGPAVGRSELDLGPPVTNLSPAGRAWAMRAGGVESAFRRLVTFVNGPAVQEVWAPTFGCSRSLPVPLDADLGAETGVDFESHLQEHRVRRPDRRGGTP
jgi:hypothetical protein